MALDVTGLVDYVKENPDQLIYRSLFDGKTINLVQKEGNIMTGVKFAEQINILSTDAIFQDGTGCTRTTSGTTALTQRKVTIGEITVVEDICVKTLNKKYLSSKLTGSRDIQIPFEKEFTDLKTATIAEQLERAVWMGDINSAGDSTIARFDGFTKLIDLAGTATNANATAYGVTVVNAATGITLTNVVSIVNAMWLALPAKVQGKKDIRIFCGWDTFQKFIAAYTTLNLFAFAPAGGEISAENGEVVIPGTNYKLTAVHGLDTTVRLFAMRTSNMFIGTDLQNEEEKFELVPDQFNNYLHFQVDFKYGVNVAFPGEITTFKTIG